MFYNHILVFSTIIVLSSRIILTEVANQNENFYEKIINLPEGKIEGRLKISPNGRNYLAFEGVPYAEAPVGKLRFQDPKKKKSWIGIWQANTLSKCIQYNPYTKPGDDPVLGEEDCLHLNIYVPVDNSTGVKDVIIFIHGGAFMFNHGGSYAEKYLMNHDVIYITFNYRLGPLGFLSTEDSVVPGNAGLKDQKLALEWVKKNVGYFNGNSDSITLSGMSAGGSSVHLHSLNRKNVNLFHKMIIQSGTGLNPWVMAENSREKVLKLGKLTGCESKKMEKVIECLKHRPARQIVQSVKDFQPFLNNPSTPFGIVVDAHSKNPILPKHPHRLLKDKEVVDVPVIFSSVLAEGLSPTAQFLGQDYLSEIESNWNNYLPFILDYNNTVENVNEISQRIKEFYMKEETLNEKSFPRFLQMATDRLYLSDIDKAIKLHSAAISSNVYYYFFTYRGVHSKSDYFLRKKENFGPAHCDDTIYVLSTSSDVYSNSEDASVAEILQNIWITFAARGNPQVPNVNWIPISKNSTLDYLRIESSSEIKMSSIDSFGNREFWESLNLQENENYEKTSRKKDEL